VGYDNKRKGWRCCDLTTGWCHVSRNVVIDKASLWWSSEAVLLLDSKVIKEELEEKLQKELELENEHPYEDGSVHASSKPKKRSPWHTRVHQTSQEKESEEKEEKETQETTQSL
jgi:hypothetical protein